MTNSILKEFLDEFLGSLPKVRLAARGSDENDLDPPLSPTTGFPLIGPGYDLDAGGCALGDLPKTHE
jgi:hypothetical protein